MMSLEHKLSFMYHFYTGGVRLVMIGRFKKYRTTGILTEGRTAIGMTNYFFFFGEGGGGGAFFIRGFANRIWSGVKRRGYIQRDLRKRRGYSETSMDIPYFA